MDERCWRVFQKRRRNSNRPMYKLRLWTLTLDPEETPLSPTKHATGGPSYLSYLALTALRTCPPTRLFRHCNPPFTFRKDCETRGPDSRQNSTMNHRDRHPAFLFLSLLRQRPNRAYQPVKRLHPSSYFPHFVDHLIILWFSSKRFVTPVGQA